MYKNSRQLIEELGGYRSVAPRLGIRPTTMHSHLSAQKIPAKWYAAMCDLAREMRVMPPNIDLFDFKPLVPGTTQALAAEDAA